jgi:phage shock protein A
LVTEVVCVKRGRSALKRCLIIDFPLRKLCRYGEIQTEFLYLVWLIMGILDRLNTLIKSNINNTFARAETPRMQYEQAIRDMEDAVRSAKQQVVTTIADEKRLSAEAERKRDEVYRWENRATAALQAGDEQLAREAIIQKRRVEDEERELRHTAARHRAMAEELKNSVAQLDAKVRDAKARYVPQSAPAPRPAPAQGQYTPPPPQDAYSGPLGDNRNFEAFERQARQIDAFDAQAEAMREIEDLDGSSALEDRFRALERSDSGGASDELEALKAKLSRR